VARSRRLRLALLVIGAALGTVRTATPIAAQGTKDTHGEQRIAWQGRGLRYAGCLQFLVSPERVGDLLENGWLPLRADADSALGPAIRSTVESDAKYAAWTPGQVCVIRVDAFTGEGRSEPNSSAEGDLIVLAAIAGTPREGGPPAMQADPFQVSDWRLIEAARTHFLRLDGTDAQVARPDEGLPERLTVKLGRATLAWDGFAPVAAPAAADSGAAAPVDAVTWRWQLAGGNSHWTVVCRLKPAARRGYSGGVTIAGKGDLAKALSASPIMFVGQVYRGGSAEIEFERSADR
jgi:hypothetical protein